MAYFSLLDADFRQDPYGQDHNPWGRVFLFFLIRTRSNIEFFAYDAFSRSKQAIPSKMLRLKFKTKKASRQISSVWSSPANSSRTAVLCPTITSRRSPRSTWCCVSEEAVASARRRTTPRPRRSSTRRRRSSSPCWNTTRWTKMARSRAWDASAPTRFAARASSWPTTLTDNTVASAVWPTCSTSPKRKPNKCVDFFFQTI